MLAGLHTFACLSRTDTLAHTHTPLITTHQFDTHSDRGAHLSFAFFTRTKCIHTQHSCIHFVLPIQLSSCIETCIAIICLKACARPPRSYHSFESIHSVVSRVGLFLWLIATANTHHTSSIQQSFGFSSSLTDLRPNRTEIQVNAAEITSTKMC